MELSSLVCLHLHAPQSTCHKQADDMQTCQKPQKQSTKKKKRENTLVLSSTTTGICNHIQSTQPTLIPVFFFFRSSSSEPTSNAECRRTADSNSFSRSRWLLQKTWAECFDFNKSKWATRPCFIKGSSDRGKYPFFSSALQFVCFFFPHENRCYALYSDG